LCRGHEFQDRIDEDIGQLHRPAVIWVLPNNAGGVRMAAHGDEVHGFVRQGIHYCELIVDMRRQMPSLSIRTIRKSPGAWPANALREVIS
jgi:hypothetical protein